MKFGARPFSQAQRVIKRGETPAGLANSRPGHCWESNITHDMQHDVDSALPANSYARPKPRVDPLDGRSAGYVFVQIDPGSHTCKIQLHVRHDRPLMRTC